MMSFSRTVLYRSTLMAIAALVAAAAFAAHARAACGDYVLVRGQKMFASHASHELPVEPDQPMRPCNGPHCSQAPVDAPQTTAPHVSFGGHEFAKAILACTCLVDSDSCWHAVELSEAPIFLSSSIFHPPRSV